MSKSLKRRNRRRENWAFVLLQPQSNKFLPVCKEYFMRSISNFVPPFWEWKSKLLFLPCLVVSLFIQYFLTLLKAALNVFSVLLLLQTLKWAKQSSIRQEYILRQLKIMLSSIDLNKYATQIIIASTYPLVQGRTGFPSLLDCLTGDYEYFPEVPHNSLINKLVIINKENSLLGQIQMDHYLLNICDYCIRFLLLYHDYPNDVTNKCQIVINNLIIDTQIKIPCNITLLAQVKQLNGRIMRCINPDSIPVQVIIFQLIQHLYYMYSQPNQYQQRTPIKISNTFIHVECRLPRRKL
ncbi:Hypothetical_protein [Hexamita inflata]|uniref:Hypothetical_protein n=1 Tax=Hexamita inflata TaxID=28002 RepID=A0AA86RP09_9EUKA|nr:Hypothetical protein HINF_LOCUS65696 [Hexamita inflata]